MYVYTVIASLLFSTFGIQRKHNIKLLKSQMQLHIYLYICVYHSHYIISV